MFQFPSVTHQSRPKHKNKTENFIFHSHLSSYCGLSACYPRRGNIQTEGVRYHDYIKEIIIISKH